MPGTSRNFDVLIVGGGPAGSATAIYCRSHGLRTILLESEWRPAERPGETLHPGIEVLFQSLGILEQVKQGGFLRHAGYQVITSEGRDFRAYGRDLLGEWRGFQVPRSELDAILLRRAIEVGTEIVRPARVIDVLRERSRIAGVLTTAGEYSCTCLVDSSGGVHWLQRRLGFPLWEVSGTLIARYGWMAISRQGSLPEFRIEGCGWFWQAPVKPGLDAWVSLDLEGSAKNDSGSAAGSRPVTWRIARPCAGPGYYLVGDAACVIDPAGAQGILKAFLSARFVAESIAASIRNKELEKEAQVGYCAWIESAFCREALGLIDAYSRFDPAPSWLGSALDAVRYIMMHPCI
jgi:flavin-dependent dehydrogenase